MVIRDGGVIEEVRLLGYDGPSYLFADLTHPLVDLFPPYTTPRTLAEQATGRLRDAIVIVKEVKETLEDKRFTSSSYRARGDWNQVNRAHSGLTVMLDAMIRHAAEISFDGVMVSE